MKIILIHGMGRTPASLLLLRHRLRKLGYTAQLFGYLPAVESLQHVSQRLITRIHRTIGSAPYALVGHSLGTVIIRHAVSLLETQQLQTQPPVACFFLAPPMIACQAARFFSRFWLYRRINGEMGQLLAQDAFMAQLPIPFNTKLYVGTGGPRGTWLPLGQQLNDGILSVTEATGSSPLSVLQIPALHTFIMNADGVAEDIHRSLAALA